MRNASAILSHPTPPTPFALRQWGTWLCLLSLIFTVWCAWALSGHRATRLKPFADTTHSLENERLVQLIRRNTEVKQVLRVVRRFAPAKAKTKGIASMIVEESNRAGLDPLFVTAVVKSESTFRIAALSNRSAKGLMQITPITEREVAPKIDRSGLTKRDLSDARYNLRLGTSYLRELQSRFRGDISMALVAYNWGPTHLKAALRGEKRIPGEALKYARTIMHDHRTWASQG